jgi:predicted Na+-dependent transporter
MLALPLPVGVVMLGPGLTLTVADFAHVTGYPRAVFAALGRPLSRRLHDQLERA